MHPVLALAFMTLAQLSSGDSRTFIVGDDKVSALIWNNVEMGDTEKCQGVYCLGMTGHK